MRFHYSKKEVEKLRCTAENTLSSDEILVEKKAKQGKKKVAKEVNIKEHIKSFELCEENGILVLCTVISSSTSININ